ncbi:universal stress protein [Gelidibacter maritimus]|uniref:Universal stress protein n=1 Tax=Gelidibacter maritimus TaxID=2761487 RepID=A0A7W2M440_9FLAO|nr:universal stress protein [Gelidibacter maritimus]MBA6152341.1 universal stress protein [Gelidibacter maritimus]
MMSLDKLNILIPTDFSANAWTATQYALNLYADRDCTFYFLNSISLAHSDSRSYITAKYLDTLAETSKNELDALKDRAAQLNNPKHGFEVISTSEEISQAIKRAVKINGIDMVITGTKGATGVNRYFLGSNTVKIMQSLKSCPMIAVPDAHEFKVPKHIAFPTDFTRVFEAKEIQALLNFADLYRAHIYILHLSLQGGLNVLQETNMRDLQAHLVNHQYTFHWMEKSGTKSDEINEFVVDFDIDVLAMVNYKHSFVEKVIKEPVIKKIGFQPIVPFLVIPE